ncbi:MAG TPA: ABC transporter permease [Fulvivirga sp.]|nr:ABC transporter permease [Fulvivirga sp.]
MIKNIFKTTIRSILKTPIHSAINILGLSIGLATVLLIVLWVNFHQSYDGFHTKYNEIYQVMTNTSSSSTNEIQTTPGAVYKVMEDAQAEIPDINRMTRIIANWRWPSEQCFKIEESKPCIYTKGIYADSSFFKIFDFEIIKGASNPLLNPKSIALSESLAKQLYGETDPIGKIYKMDNHLEVEVAAVFKDIVPTSSLQFGFVAPIVIAQRLMGQSDEQMSQWSFITYVDIPNKAVAKVNKAINSLERMKDYQNTEYFVQPLSEAHLYTKFENGHSVGGLIVYVQMFLLFALFILLMSIVNFINLATAKSAVRSKEIGVRKVTGASKLAIMGQFLVEALIKVVMATLLALLVVYYLLSYFNEMTGVEIHFQFDQYLIALILSMVIISTLLAGAYPAFVMSKFNPIKALKNKEGTQSGGNRLRKSLTIVQISLSVIIITVTSSIYLQIEYLKNKDIGYDRKGIMMLEPTWQHVKNYESFTNELMKDNLIKAVGVSNANLVDASFATDRVEWPGKIEGDKLLFKLIGINNGLIDVLGLNLLEGTVFNEQDSLDQVILTKSAAGQMNLTNAVGSIVEVYGDRARVVGLVDDFNSESLHKGILPTVLYKIEPKNAGTFYIRYNKERPKESINSISAVYSKFEPFFTMKYDLLDDSYQKQYENEKIIGNFSMCIMIISVLIALIGILGLSTYNTIRRYKEIGIRKVFGASVAQIITLLSMDFVKVGIIANLIAWPIAWYLVDIWLTGFAYRIDFPTQLFILSSILSIGFIIVLVIAQSFKTALLNPSEVMRED